METRFNGNVVPFASNATSGERTIFGDWNTESDNIDDNLNADFIAGWEAGLEGALNPYPPSQYFNAALYTSTKLIAYLYQQGIAEWNTTQEYKTNSIAVGSNGNIYKSIIDSNIGNNPTTDSINWINLLSDFVKLNGEGADNAVPRFDTTGSYIQNSVLAISDSGNMALADNLYSWSGYTGFDIKQLSLASGTSNAEIGFNFFYDGTNWRRKKEGYATRMGTSLTQGEFIFYTANTASANSIITWEESFRMSKSGIVTFRRSPYLGSTLSYGENLDNLIESGLHYSVDSINTPTGVDGHVEVFNYSSLTACQIFHVYNGDSYIRRKVSSVWGAWYQIKTNKNSLGENQTWQLVTRAINVNFTNTTGRPIQFHVRIEDNALTYLIVTIDGVDIECNGSNQAGEYITGTFIIPPNSVYKFRSDASTITSYKTYELR